MIMKSSTKQSIPNPDNNVKNNTTISHDEYQNITHQVYYTSVSSNPRYKPKIRKKTGNNCYTLNLLKTNGNIHLLYNDEKIYFCKLRMVEFDDHFDELLEKGKVNLGNYFKQDSNHQNRQNGAGTANSRGDLIYWLRQRICKTDSIIRTR